MPQQVVVKILNLQTQNITNHFIKKLKCTEMYWLFKNMKITDFTDPVGTMYKLLKLLEVLFPNSSFDLLCFTLKYFETKNKHLIKMFLFLAAVFSFISSQNVFSKKMTSSKL